MARSAVIRVTDVLGAGMDCLDAADVGRIAELVVGAGSRRVLYVVVKARERLGRSSKDCFAVPWGAVSAFTGFDGRRRYRVPISLTRLRGAPTFPDGEWPDFGDTKEMAEVHSFFGEPPAG
jgi:hypothetical protein